MSPVHAIQRSLLPAALLIVWEFGGDAGLLPTYLSTPSAIARAFVEVARGGELTEALAASLYRVYAGFALGAALGVLAGLAAGLTVPVRNFFDPLVSFLYPIPKIALLPVFLMLFGLGHGSKIAIIAFSVFFPVFIASRYAVLSVDRLFVWTARNMATPPLAIFFRMILPAAAPQVLSGVRVGLAMSFVLLFAAELIGARTGLGYLIAQGEESVRFDIMFAGIVSFAVLGFASDRVLMAIRRRLLRGQSIGTQETAS